MLFSPITPFDFQKERYFPLDFTENNPELVSLDFGDIEAFNKYVFDKLDTAGVKVGLGGWLEKRIVYNNKPHFQGEEQRCFHLGVDIWAKAYTPVFAPENCTLHSFKNNAQNGDYGPTIILKSCSQDLFYLFGHLSIESLTSLQNRKVYKKGEHFAEIGPYPENGNWPLHLHFQVMNSMEGRNGDFPGVCSEKELAHVKTICLDPRPFLGL